MLKNRFFWIGYISGVISLIAFIALFFFVLIQYFEKQSKDELETEITTFKPEVVQLNTIDWGIFNGFHQNVDTTKKVYVINFWATWCKPCIKEMPSFQQLVNNKNLDFVEFLFVSNEDPTKIYNFVTQKEWEFPLYTIDDVKRKETFTYDGIPTTYIFRKEDNIALKYTGGLNWNSTLVTDLLKSMNN